MSTPRLITKVNEPEYKFPRVPSPKEPTRLILNPSDTLNIINKLPSYGVISYDPSTCYWYIKLPQKWQQSSEKIVNSIEKTYNHSPWYKESNKLGECWSHLVDVANPSISRKQLRIDSVTPPSVVGLHISLGVHSKTAVNFPETLQENKKVEFSKGNIISFRSVRKTPQNIPGQYTNGQNLRYYPTRWLFVEVTFNNFQFKTKYKPHISLACIAVLLNVNAVERFQNIYQKHKQNMTQNILCLLDANNPRPHNQISINNTTINNTKSTNKSMITNTRSRTLFSIKMSLLICICTFLLIFYYGHC